MSKDIEVSVFENLKYGKINISFITKELLERFHISCLASGFWSTFGKFANGCSLCEGKHENSLAVGDWRPGNNAKNCERIQRKQRSNGRELTNISILEIENI